MSNDNSFTVFFQKQPFADFPQKRFLKNFAKATENTCAGVSVLIKLQTPRLELYSLRNSGTNVFL